MTWTERYCTVSGAGAHDGTSEANAWTFAEAVTNYAVGHRVNVKAGTHTFSTSQDLNTVTGVATPACFRGYKTTIGDLDSIDVTTLTPGTDYPSVQNSASSSQVVFTGDCLQIMNMDFQKVSGSSGSVSSVSGSGIRFWNCSWKSVVAGCLSITADPYTWFDHCSFFVDTVTANLSCISYTGASDHCYFDNCYFRTRSTGTAAGVSQAGSPLNFYRRCVFDRCNYGIYIASGSPYFKVDQCVFYNCVDGIRQNVSNIFVPTIVKECIFHSNTGYGFNQSAGTNHSTQFVRNVYYNNTSGKYAGLGTYIEHLEEYAESTDPCVDAANGDWTIVDTANSYNLNRRFGPKNLTGTMYLSPGPAGHDAAAGGGGAGTGLPLPIL